MRYMNLRFAFGLLVFAMFSLQVAANVTLPSIVSDGMVLQRNTPLKIWGWGAPGEKVTVNFAKKSYSTTTGNDGKWMVKLKPLNAGGPYKMVIKGKNTIVLNDILMGDVWVCSGQSNMTHYLGRHAERYAKEIAEANFPQIRQFYVPEKVVISGPADNTPGLKWVSADPKSVLDFTVIGYFFVKKLYDKYQVPMGIINTCVGGTPIEAWMSEDGFKEFPDILKTVKQNQDTAYVNGLSRRARANMGGNVSRMPRQETDKGLADAVKWFDQAYVPLNWKRINIPGYWEDQGIRNLDGVVWYRRVIDVPASMTGVKVVVKLGRIVNADELYINGQKVGNTTYEYPQRVYDIKAGVLKPGKNIFVIRVTNSGGKGGFVPDKPYYLLAGNDTVDLKGDWYYKVGQVNQRRRMVPGAGAPMIASPQSNSSPTALYNGMIAPYTNYAVKGFLWYQGETNADRPQQYQKFLPTLINDWRSKWQLGNLTFLIAQLPNYMDVNYSPEESNWAEMRRIQLETAEKMPMIGLGINIDLGEWNDIHPSNKKPVGERLALQAMKITYGDKTVVSSGPVRKAARIEGNKVIISFDNVGTGLVSGNGEPLAHFAIAGEDGRYEWANAEIVNNEVVVWSDEVQNPKSVRYAWADNPDFANLYNKEGLPASPFQMTVK